MGLTISNDASPKQKKFIAEVNKLCDKYQFDLVPRLSYLNAGVVPVLKVTEIIPPDEPSSTIKKKPTVTK
jgi:hypothetical protein